MHMFFIIHKFLSLSKAPNTKFVAINNKLHTQISHPTQVTIVQRPAKFIMFNIVNKVSFFYLNMLNIITKITANSLQ